MTEDTVIYRKALAPLDGSEIAEVVLAYVKELAGRLGLDLLLLHVCRPEEYEMHPMHRMYIEHAAHLIRQHFASVHNNADRSATDKQNDVRGILTIGHPAEEILRCIDDNDVDFIIMATHGHSARKRWSIGSVTDKVLRTSKVPVWLVRAGIPYELVHDRYPRITVLVPLDGSELAEAVFPVQRGLERVDLVLLRVCEPTIIPSGYRADLSEDWASYTEQRLNQDRQEAEKYLDTLAKNYQDAGIRVKTVVKTGQPAAEIISFADAHPLNLVVMATHGWSGHVWRPWGSVTEMVLEGISSPLLLVRPSQIGSDYQEIKKGDVKKGELSRSG